MVQLVLQCAELKRACSGVFSTGKGVISHGSSGYALSPNSMPFGWWDWNCLYSALSLRMRASWTDPGHFTTQLVIMRSAVHYEMWMLCLPFQLTHSHSLSQSAWICTWVQSMVPIVLGMFPIWKNLCLVWAVWSSLRKETNWLIRLPSATDTAFTTLLTVDFLTPIFHQLLGGKSQMRKSSEWLSTVPSWIKHDSFGFGVGVLA